MAGFLVSSRVAAALCLLLCLVGPTFGEVYFSSLKRTLAVSASFKQGQVLKAGVDKITVAWGLNQSAAANADAYRKVKVKLCYAPVSQTDRAWRKTVDSLKKDKTCQFTVTTQAYTSAPNTSFEYTIKRNVPTATYFVRAYVLDASDTEVAYGQTTDAHKKTNLFQIEGITGRHASLDIAAGCFSAFSILALAFFFTLEKRKAKK